MALLDIFKTRLDLQISEKEIIYTEFEHEMLEARKTCPHENASHVIPPPSLYISSQPAYHNYLCNDCFLLSDTLIGDYPMQRAINFWKILMPYFK